MRRSGAERYPKLRKEKNKRKRTEDAVAHKTMPKGERSVQAPQSGAQDFKVSEGSRHPKLLSVNKGKKPIRRAVGAKKAQEKQKEAPKKKIMGPKIIQPKMARDFHADRQQLMSQIQEAKSEIMTYSYIPGWLKNSPTDLANYMGTKAEWVQKEKEIRKRITAYNKELRRAVECGAIPPELHEKLILTPESNTPHR